MIRDDFHGAGGWHVALMMLGCTEQTLGVEMEPHPVATARAAGATVIRADVRHLRGDALGRPRLYIASPPCQTYSPAGKRAGIATLPLILAAVQLVADGETPADAYWREKKREDALRSLGVFVVRFLSPATCGLLVLGGVLAGLVGGTLASRRRHV